MQTIGITKKKDLLSNDDMSDCSAQILKNDFGFPRVDGIYIFSLASFYAPRHRVVWSMVRTPFTTPIQGQLFFQTDISIP